MISVYDVRNMNIDTAELINNGGSCIEINSGIVIEFNAVKILESMNGFIDAIKSGVGKLVEFAIHGERDIKITGSIEEENFVLGGIHYHDEINVGAGGKRQGMIAIIDTAEINGKRSIERSVSGGLDVLRSDFNFDIGKNLELVVDRFVIVF